MILVGLLRKIMTIRENLRLLHEVCFGKRLVRVIGYYELFIFDKLYKIVEG